MEIQSQLGRSVLGRPNQTGGILLACTGTCSVYNACLSVFCKYLTTPHAYLWRIVDIYKWMEKKRIYREWLSRIPMPEEQRTAVKPDPAKTVYLNYWITKNLSTRFLGIPAILKIFFTLPTHDSFRDMLSILLVMSSQKKEAKKVYTEFEAIAQEKRGAGLEI